MFTQIFGLKRHVCNVLWLVKDWRYAARYPADKQLSHIKPHKYTLKPHKYILKGLNTSLFLRR